ncbi:hypothetical protein ACKFKG_06015 [Phormidesmis sp. 146-35]
MRFCFMRSGYVWVRFLRYKLSPWITVAIAPLNLLCSSGVNRVQAKIRCMRAVSKINFAGFYGLINDLLW